MTEVHNQEIHLISATGVAGSSGWYALYRKKEDMEIAETLPIACWVLLQTRAQRVEVPNEQKIPVVMGMVVHGDNFRLIHAPAFPGWVFQKYMNDDERDEWLQEQQEKIRDEARRKDDKKYQKRKED